jgi:hypothetical protein
MVFSLWRAFCPCHGEEQLEITKKSPLPGGPISMVLDMSTTEVALLEI